jgi:class 3 adenylate cyclase
LDVGQRGPEHADVTVMFADVVGSMQLAAAVGPDRFWEVIVEVVRRCAAVLREHGGALDKFTGDGVMAVFGAPVASDDHALRACLAALDIQREVRRLAAMVERADDSPLRLRVGLNSGPVLFGDFGPAAVGSTAIGEAVGFAQRMEAVAPPGGVLVSEATARLVDGAAVLGPTELVCVKGVDRPVPARRLLAVEPGWVGVATVA